MEFGVRLSNTGHLPLDQGVVRMALHAEAVGYDSVWVGDHVVVPRDYELDEEHAQSGDLGKQNKADPLISLTYIAGATRRIRLGTSILIAPIRNPLLLAKMVSTLDVLSGGRLVLGLGVGWIESEMLAMAAPPFAKRGRVTDEWIRIMRACWTEEAPEYDGDYYRFSPLYFNPKPARPTQILIGGQSAPALRRAGRLGDGWTGSRVTPDQAQRSIAQIREHARQAGRDDAALTFAAGVEIDLLAPGQDASTSGLIGSRERALLGTADEIADGIRRYEQAGIDWLELRFRAVRDSATSSIEPTLEMMEHVASDVLPQVRS